MKVKVDYDPATGNITAAGGVVYYVGIGLNFELDDAGNNVNESDVVKLSNNGMNAKDLINLRKAGVI